MNGGADRRKYPLRKILIEGWGATSDYLECGHMIPGATDMYGKRFPQKRRCHKCAKEKPQEFDPKTINAPM